MNKYEIKKAFDICCDAQTQSCTGCPILELEKRNGRGCKYNMFISVFDLITEQENEIERLKDDYAKLQEQFAQYQVASDKKIRAQKKEAEKRFEGNMKAVLEIEKKQAKIDVLNKAKKCSYCDNDFMDGKWHRYVLVSDIDELIKEVENDKCNC